MGIELARAFVNVRADTNTAKEQLRGFQAQGTSIMASTGAKMGAAFAGAFAVTAVLASVRSFASESLMLAERQAKAEARLAAVIAATGKSAGFSIDQLKKQASALQKVTTVGDESILELQAVIATFRSISGSHFEETTELALDLAEVMQQDAKSGALQLAKALEDPIRGITALRRSGVSFTQQQQDQIRELVETNRLWDAQTMILDTVRKQIGGVAREMANMPFGELQQLKNKIGDLKEQIGDELVPAAIDWNNLKLDFVKGFVDLQTAIKTVGFLGFKDDFDAIRQSVVETGPEIRKMSSLLSDLVFNIDDVSAIERLKESFTQAKMSLMELLGFGQKATDAAQQAASERDKLDTSPLLKIARFDLSNLGGRLQDAMLSQFDKQSQMVDLLQQGNKKQDELIALTRTGNKKATPGVLT